MPQNSLKPPVLRLTQDESGQDLVEYALIAGAIGVLTVAGVHGLGTTVSGYLNTITNAFKSAIGLT